jgi:hypothetical protein
MRALRVLPLLVMIVLPGDEITEAAPFFDGLFFTYGETFTNPERGPDPLWTRTVTYRFQGLGDGTFRVREEAATVVGPRLRAKGIQSVPSVGLLPDTRVDSRGTVVKSGGFGFMKGTRCILWLAPASRRVDAMPTLFVERVFPKTTWHTWTVLPVAFMDLQAIAQYYDVQTGILVGWRASYVERVLIDTNFIDAKQLIVEGRDGSGNAAGDRR